MREMEEGARIGHYDLHGYSYENLVPKPDLVVTDVFNDYIASELMS